MSKANAKSAEQTFINQNKTPNQRNKRRYLKKFLVCLLFFLINVGLLGLLAMLIFIKPEPDSDTNTNYKAYRDILLWKSVDENARWSLPVDEVSGEYLRTELYCDYWRCNIRNYRTRGKKVMGEYDAVLFDTSKPHTAEDLYLPKRKYNIFFEESTVRDAVLENNGTVDLYNVNLNYQKDQRTIVETGRLLIDRTTKSLAQHLIDSTATKPATLKALYILPENCEDQSMQNHPLEKEIRGYKEVDIICGTVDNPTFAQYKFIFLFENSFCVDSQRLNFYRAIQNGVVPVLLSSSNHYTPYGTISDGEFGTVKELMAYLHEVSENSYMFSRYLRLGYIYHISPDASVFCEICSFLHSRDESKNTDFLLKTIVSHWWRDRYCDRQ